MKNALRPFSADAVKLLPSMFAERFDLNRRYMLSLKNRNLLQNHYYEAGLLFGAYGHGIWPELEVLQWRFEDFHWGWESPTSHYRGHFVGHWLSAAARIYASTHDLEIRTRAEQIVSELGKCQKQNGGEWAGPIPAKFLDQLAAGRSHLTPHYIVHKTFMGLFEMYSLAGSEQALDILTRWAAWFHRWSGQFTRQQMDDILDAETGGMLEVWADLYAATGQQTYVDLMQRYDRPRFFDRLLAGEDVLTNRHGNTTMTEIHGAARAWEVTGNPRWRDIVEAYWRMAVTERGTFCTGGQTSGEIWTPPHEMAARLGDRNQEHCTVYNMMRLAEYLLRWTGDVTYADYWERNLYNGRLAQQHPDTGMVAYYLPLRAGGSKPWSTPTMSFWCCVGTLVQAQADYSSQVYFEDDEGVVVSQFIPTELTCQRSGVDIKIIQTVDPQANAIHRPQSWNLDLHIACAQPSEFTLNLRLPWWLAGPATITVNGQPERVNRNSSGYHSIRRVWQQETVKLEFPKKLIISPLPDRPDIVAFMDGPVVLAGQCADERILYGQREAPETILCPDDERDIWNRWKHGYRTRAQEHGIRFLPLYEIRDEPYTVHFPVKDAH